MSTAVSLTDFFKGDAQTVETRWGPLTVTICGDRSKTPCLTFHDVGLNHRSCFQSLMLALGPASLLTKNFCFYHVDAPGCQVSSAEVPATFLPLSLPRLAEALTDVVQHYKLREVLGLGAGVGGQVLVQLAAEHPKLFCGLILVSPSCQRPGWWEWAWGKVAARQLMHRGWGPSPKQYFIQRLFGELMQQAMGGASDLLQAYRRECDELPPQAVAHYLWAALSRPDSTTLLPALRCRLLLVYGAEALHKEDCLELSRRVAKDRFAVLEVAQAGGLASEEKPQDVVGVVESFITALQLEGFGLGPQLRVGE